MLALAQDIPKHLVILIESLRVCMHDVQFQTRHRVRNVDFTRRCRLNFPVVMFLALQKTAKSIQRHLHEFLDRLAGGQLFEPLTTGSWTHARAKLKHTAFIELNEQCVLPVFYGAERGEGMHRWRGHRLLGVDSSLVRLPNHESLGEEFGWMESSNQNGLTGTRYPEGRISVLYDVLNHCGLEARLESNRQGEISLAMDQIEHVKHLQPGDILITDQGYTGFTYLAVVVQRGLHFIARCSPGSFLPAQEMFRSNRANQSRVVWLMASPKQKAECQRLGLPWKMKVRFVSLRLPSGELEVLATSLLDEESYPTAEFLTVYHWRWEHETFHLMLKGRLDLENFSGYTVEAIRQDFHAAMLMCNLERLLSQPAKEALQERTTSPVRVQVNRSVSYHALKHELFSLLFRDIPPEEVIRKLVRLFCSAPVAVRPDRKPPERRPPSPNRSYHHQRRSKKIVY